MSCWLLAGIKISLGVYPALLAGTDAIFLSCPIEMIATIVLLS